MRAKTAIACTLLAAGSLSAQELTPRSATYLFSADVEDARALWINPAGLGILPVATIYAELAADKGGTSGDWAMRQYSFGLHTRHIAVSYQKDRFVSGGSDGTWRVGAAFPLAPRMAFGIAWMFTSPQRTIDAGIRVSPARPVDVGLVLRNIGSPDVRGVEQPVTGVAGMAWHLANGRIGFQTDAIAVDRQVRSGFDVRYRAGMSLVFPARQPISLVTALDFGNDLHVSRWSLGIALGLQAQLLAVGTSLPGEAAATQLQSFSITGVAIGRGRR